MVSADSRNRPISFNPLPSHEGRPRTYRALPLRLTFNPLPSHEGRRKFVLWSVPTYPFNPLPSHEGRPQRALIFFSKAAHFSDITNNNISSNKIAPYLQHFLRYKKLIFSGANLPGNLCSLMVRTILPYKISHSLFKTITVPSHQIRALLQYALPYFYIGLPNNKNVDCPFLCL